MLPILFFSLFSILIFTQCKSKEDQEVPIIVKEVNQEFGDTLSTQIMDLSEWFVFGNPDDNNKLYKIKSNGTELTKLSDSKYEGLRPLTNWIYYIDRQELNNSGRLCRVQYDGTNQQTMTSERVEGFCVTENYVFYILDNNIYRIQLDGSSKMKLISDNDKIYTLMHYEDYIYYNTNNGIYKIHTNGQDHTCIIDGYYYQFALSGNKIFYHNDAILYADLEGAGERELLTDYLSDMVVEDNMLYYSKGNYLYKMAIGSQATEKLYVGGTAKNYTIDKDWLYFYCEQRIVKAKKDLSDFHIFFGKGVQAESDMYFKLSDEVYLKNYDYDEVNNGTLYFKLFKLDDNSLGKIKADYPVELCVAYQDQIYYTNAIDKMLYRIDTVTSKPEMILDNKIGAFKIKEDRIYYTDIEKNYALYEYHLLTGNVKQITDRSVYRFLLDDNRVYFCDLTEDCSLYSLQNNKYEKVVNTSIRDFVVLENTIYYTDEKDHGTLYRINKDGNKQKLTEHKVEDLYVYKDTVYYVIKNGTNLLYKIKNDDSDPKFIDIVGAEYVDMKIFNDRIYICYASHGELYFTAEKYLEDLKFEHTLSSTKHFSIHEWDYFIYNINNVMGYLYKYNKKENTIELAVQKGAINLKRDGDWLYYSGVTNESSYYPYPYIDRLNSKTGEVQEVILINKSNVYEIEYEVNYPNILYHYEDDNRLWIKNLNTGLTNSMIGDCTSLQAVKDGWIYYINNESSGKICRIRMDGTMKQTLTSQSSQYIYSNKEYLYYLSFEEQDDYRGYLFKTALNESYKQLIFHEKLSIWDYVVYKDYLYFNYNGLNVYHLSTDTSKKIYEQELEYFYIEADRILCSIYQDGGYKTIEIDIEGGTIR